MTLRHHQAAVAAKVLDRAFFVSQPARLFHSRRSLPFEFSDWDATGHDRWPIVVAHRQGNHIATSALGGRLGNVPDHERFLSLLWSHLETFGHDIPASVHLELAKAAGLVDEKMGIPK
jgi:hypothetical protein